MNVHDYLIDHTSFNWSELLQEWHWLLPNEFTVWLFTRAGDLFIAMPDGSIKMLEVGGGTLEHLVGSRDEFCTKIDEADNADDWLMIPIIDRLSQLGHVLEPGSCFSYRILPVLGGEYDVENRVPLPIHEHFGAWGSIHRQLQDVPDGSQVIIQPTTFS
ncbi:MAG: T6SS immunity protein Tdi1 domain-containing protein [Prosthecobacter sp.]